MPRRDFGGERQPGRPVEERTARRVIETPPDLDDLPRRIGFGRGNGREVQLPSGPTGAAGRTPGVALDEDLRRSRIFRGREPRTLDPAQSSPPATTPAAGAVVRPEPRTEDRPPSRVVRPSIQDGPDKRVRGQSGIERATPREAGGGGIKTEIDPPISKPSEPRPEPRTESPRSEPAPRVESPRPESRPEPRVESPRPESRPGSAGRSG